MGGMDRRHGGADRLVHRSPHTHSFTCRFTFSLAIVSRNRAFLLLDTLSVLTRLPPSPPLHLPLASCHARRQLNVYCSWLCGVFRLAYYRQRPPPTRRAPNKISRTLSFQHAIHHAFPRTPATTLIPSQRCIRCCDSRIRHSSAVRSNYSHSFISFNIPT